MLLPLLIDVTDYLPMTGVFWCVLAVGCSAHLHSSDGTGAVADAALPGVERADIRGRQLAWLLVVGPAGGRADRARRDRARRDEHGARGRWRCCR